MFPARTLVAAAALVFSSLQAPAALAQGDPAVVRYHTQSLDGDWQEVYFKSPSAEAARRACRALRQRSRQGSVVDDRSTCVDTTLDAWQAAVARSAGGAPVRLANE